MGSVFECFIRAVTGAGPAVATAVGTAVGTAIGAAVATAVPGSTGSSKTLPTGVLQLIGPIFVFRNG